MKDTAFYVIKCITNLHVGSGETSFGVVDNLVQRDVNTQLPTIHSSSIKGALREFFQNNNTEVLPIFGDEKNAGKWQFLSADLLSRPLRSSKSPYFNATSTSVVKSLIQKLTNFGLPVPNDLLSLSFQSPEKGHPIVFSDEYRGAIIEELDWVIKDDSQIQNITLLPWVNAAFGENLALLHPDDFQSLELPVIARNHLENGKSENLWYEEVVPYDSRFATFIIQSPEMRDTFEKGLEDMVQIGANASIGYGLCKFFIPNRP
ncbi:MAG: type III-B CRISPR module RAMP protein Cmr4 [Lunatimonas sp.]|uniref:type III-B CRISPR module RAMP protein Cmr4 n=1 Tax=Lunatimonas sp. TaxID=2060141 RepID=UPI00263B9AB6|nr:type III-B CRISPR module RAMP protein Cmr4 [Lunatimonas sp.]MCC5937999.1 type III-B CRISPR module RAMP protein Cmr4 [Lunatimonas sp.]